MSTLLLTGSTGFLGRILQQELDQHFEVSTLGRAPENDYVVDLSCEKPVFTKGFNLIVHAAGKAHSLPRTAEEKETFHAINHTGTLKLLQALNSAEKLPQLFVFISSVAVYGLDQGENITETSPLLGDTPYALSKIAAEKAITAWGERHGVPTVILRLPLVVGPNPPGNLGAMRAMIAKGLYFRISGNHARKSAVLATDIARLIPTLRGKSGIYNLTDGVHPAFDVIEKAIARALGRTLRWSVPRLPLRMAATLGDYLPGFPLNTLKWKKMTASLTFDDQKARTALNWNPSPVIPVLANPANWIQS